MCDSNLAFTSVMDPQPYYRWKTGIKWGGGIWSDTDNTHLASSKFTLGCIVVDRTYAAIGFTKMVGRKLFHLWLSNSTAR